MHPPLFKPHPLCKKEVEDLVKCHEDHPYKKFINACGDAKIALDLCFREEKKLRVKLNKKIGTMYPLKEMPEGAAPGTAAPPVPTPPTGGSGTPA